MSAVGEDKTGSVEPVAGLGAHPLLNELVQRASGAEPPSVGIVYPNDAPAIAAAHEMAAAGIARPVLIGPGAVIAAVAEANNVAIGEFEVVDVPVHEPRESARTAVVLARQGALSVLMKGALHTDELLGPVVDRHDGLRAGIRLSHIFVFDLPAYPKLLWVSDCVVNIAPDLAAKQEILTNAVTLLDRLGIDRPNVAAVAAVETVTQSIAATVDAHALAELSAAGHWPGVTVEGPLGFDNAVSAQAALTKRIESRIAGDVDLLIVPDLNAGNLLYKSFTYFAGGACAGIVLGARVPVVLTSRADSATARLASVALAAASR